MEKIATFENEDVYFELKIKNDGVVFNDLLEYFEQITRAHGYEDFTLETVKDKKTALLNTSIFNFDLTTRTRNCLISKSIETLGDLVSYDKKALLKSRNFGKKSLTELEGLVDSKGLSFGMSV